MDTVAVEETTENTGPVTPQLNACERQWASPGKTGFPTQKCFTEQTCLALRLSSQELEKWFKWTTHVHQRWSFSQSLPLVQEHWKTKHYKDFLKTALRACGIPLSNWDTLATDHNAWHRAVCTGLQASEEKWLHYLYQKHQSWKDRRTGPTASVTCLQTVQVFTVCAWSDVVLLSHLRYHSCCHWGVHCQVADFHDNTLF